MDRPELQSEIPPTSVLATTDTPRPQDVPNLRPKVPEYKIL